MKKLILLLLFIPIVQAVQITEIMYNPYGSDIGKEWIEIIQPKDGMTLYENNINHRVSLYKGSWDSNIAIITSNPQEFMYNYPNYQNTILKSSFSLKNTGEHLELKYNNTIYPYEYTNIYPEGHSTDNVEYGTPGFIQTNEVPEFSISSILLILTILFYLIIRKR